MTRTVADAALMMSVLSLPDARDHMSLPYQPTEWLQLERDLKGIRIGLWLDPGNGVPVDPEVREAVLKAARAFGDAGAVVQPIQSWIKPGMMEGTGRFFCVRIRETLAAMPESERDKVTAVVRRATESTANLTGSEVYHAHAQTIALRAATWAATRDFDYILSPVFPMPAFKVETIHSEQRDFHPALIGSFTAVFNYSEQPAASVNCGYTASGLPIGLQIAGRRFDDLGVLQMAKAWEAMRPAQRPWPQLPRDGSPA